MDDILIHKCKCSCGMWIGSVKCIHHDELTGVSVDFECCCGHIENVLTKQGEKLLILAEEALAKRARAYGRYVKRNAMINAIAKIANQRHYTIHCWSTFGFTGKRWHKCPGVIDSRTSKKDPEGLYGFFCDVCGMSLKYFYDEKERERRRYKKRRVAQCTQI